VQGVSDRALRSRPDSRRQGQGYDDASQSRRSSARHATHTARWRSYADRAIGGLGCPSIILLRDGYGELSVSHMWCGCLCQGGNLGATGWRAHGHRACRRVAHAQSDLGIWNWARIGITEDCYRRENPPNALRFSCRRGALHRTTSKKARSRAPKAVSCKRLLGRAVESTMYILTSLPITVIVVPACLSAFRYNTQQCY